MTHTDATASRTVPPMRYDFRTAVEKILTAAEMTDLVVTSYDANEWRRHVTVTARNSRGSLGQMLALQVLARLEAAPDRITHRRDGGVVTWSAPIPHLQVTLVLSGCAASARTLDELEATK